MNAYSSKGDEVSSPNVYTLQTMTLSKSLYIVWMNEQEKRLKDILRLASFEEKAKDPSELMTAVILEAGVLVENDYKGLSKLEEMFGEVTQI